MHTPPPFRTFEANQSITTDMGLDKNSKSQPYVAGRILAVLRQAEIKTVGADARLSTDANYREMVQLPSITFGKLMGLHSVRSGLTDELDDEMAQILSLVPATGLPKDRFTPDEESMFAVGYAHEKSYLDSL